jgi:hypothetical protein
MPTLTAYAAENGHAKYDWYFPFFDDALRGVKVERLLEIGNSAGSLRAWIECFPKAEIVGLDVNHTGPSGQDDHHAMAEAVDNFFFVLGNQADLVTLNALGSFDVVVDDGGHHSFEQIASFETLFPRMRPGGWYFIEDLHCSYVESYQDDGPTAIGFLKTLFDDVNARYFPTPRQRQWPIAEVRFADSIVGIKRDDHQ